MLETKGVVDITQLPATIRDAISVTINLGFTYLWVDSVCIIQDNEQDRTREIAKMPAVYNNAVCTITASFPVDAWQGFLGDRVQYTDHIMEIRVTHSSEEEDEEVRPVHAYPIEYDDALVVEPLAERGWALQERLLSARVLEYRRNQVHFLCPFTDEYDEKYSDGWTFDWPQNAKIWFPKNADGHVAGTLLGWEISSTENFHKIWKSIIEAYTERKLTFAADRVLAISGIAQRMAVMDTNGSSTTYIAGHWLSDFPYNLLWYISCPDWEVNQRHTRRRPTWAWTSIDTRVNAPDEMFYHPARSAVELVNYTVQLRDSNAPFGDVEDATLTLRGRASMCECRITEDYLPRKTMLHFKLTGEELGIAHFDNLTGPEDKDYTQDVSLLLTETSGDGREEFSAAGLIVVEEPSEDGKRRFSRIGVWTANEYEGDERGGIGPLQTKILHLFNNGELETFDLM
ncbi:hypothetical protein NX059_004007 [Plenodomus lindquistii]|nr:hypothetical protein NX059_004007 [Plenodomus lindquistii]